MDYGISLLQLLQRDRGLLGGIFNGGFPQGWGRSRTPSTPGVQQSSAIGGTYSGVAPTTVPGTPAVSTTPTPATVARPGDLAGGMTGGAPSAEPAAAQQRRHLLSRALRGGV